MESRSYCRYRPCLHRQRGSTMLIPWIISPHRAVIRSAEAIHPTTTLVLTFTERSSVHNGPQVSSYSRGEEHFY